MGTCEASPEPAACATCEGEGDKAHAMRLKNPHDPEAHYWQNWPCDDCGGSGFALPPGETS